MRNFIFSVLFSLITVISIQAQCTFQTHYSDDFEYSGQIPGVIPGSVYHTTPQGFCPNNGSSAFYANFQNGFTGEFYNYNYSICQNADYQFSFWTKDCWNANNDIDVEIRDGIGTLLWSQNVTTSGSTWQLIQSPIFTPTTGTINISMINNMAGGGANDMTLDDFLLEICYDGAFAGQCQAQDCSFNLGNDTTYCDDGNLLVLDAGAGYDSYTWQDNSNGQTFNVVDSGTYYCTTTITDFSYNLVANGDFESGNTGFTTDYTPGTGGAWGLLSNPATYAISTSPSLVHNNFLNCGDHTSGSGNMYIANGSSAPNTDAWCQTINVTPDTDYEFSAWAMNADGVSNQPDQMAELQFSIDGTVIGNPFSPSVNDCEWTNFNASWNSANNTSITICIENTNFTSGGAGADFALDDIIFTPVCTHTDSITVNINSYPTPNLGIDQTLCNGASTTLDATTTNASYEWQDMSTNPTFTTSTTGTHWVDITVNNCMSRDSVDITISPMVVNTAIDTVCQGDSILLPDGSYASIAGDYTDTIVNMGCNEEVITTLVVEDYPVVSLPADTLTIDKGETIIIQVENHTTGGNYEWSDNTGGSYNGAAIQVTPDTTTLYYLDAYNNEGNCLAQNNITVIVITEIASLQIPNAFTPNGDELNNLFRVANHEEFDMIELRIYNRWGELLHEGKNENHAWDGKYDGEMQTNDSYTYFIKARAKNSTENISVTGSVMLMK